MIFDQDQLGGKRSKAVLRALPPLPYSNWRPPQNPPRLDGAIMLGLDVETYDPYLKEHGPGWARGQGHLVGVSLAAEDRQGNRQAYYFPLRHEVGGEDNLNPDYVLPWLKTVLETNIPKVGANITYDVGWLQQEGVYVKGYYHDCQFAEALIDETAKTALDNLAEKYLGQHKVTSKLYEWCKAAYGGSIKDQRANIYRAPPKLVGPYAEADAYLPLEILRKQWTILEKEELLTVYDLECRLIPLMLKMRFAGISVDVVKAEKLYEEFGERVKQNYNELYNLTGIHGSVNSNPDMANMFDVVGIKYKYTDAGNPTFPKDFLVNVDHPISKLILDIRELEKLRSTFLKGSIIDSCINGKVYCSFNQMRSSSDEDGDKGAKTSRLSSNSPNLQQVPSRTKLGKEIRSLFIPDKGHECIITCDMSQGEYRTFSHFAVGEGSEELRFAYNNNPKQDYHRATQDNIKRLTGKELSRGITKNCSFLGLYGGGDSKLAKTAGIPLEEAKTVYRVFHQGATYVKPTINMFIKQAEKDGYIKSFLGRRIRFRLWEPAGYGKKGYPLPYSQALDAYGTDIKLAGLYKATNYCVQSTTAEILKQGMLNCYENGLFDNELTVRLTVHDELVWSIIDSNKYMNNFKEIAYVLENAILLKVPMIYEWNKGSNWSQCK